jgi:hypothetical protein
VAPARSPSRPGAPIDTVSRYIDEYRGRFGVEPICATLDVSASAYYQRAGGQRSQRVIADERLLEVIKSTHAANYGGDRDANRALHMIVVCRLRYCERTRAYAQRRSAQGKTKTEIIRCLKRYIAREIYHTLNADLHPKTSPPTHRPTVSIACSAGPIGTSRPAP